MVLICIGQCLIKYFIIITNIFFSLLGLAIIGLGVVAHLGLRELTELIPINLSVISIGIIVLGCVVFLIAFLACCGAITKSRWMLISYAIALTILVGFQIYVVVVMFSFLKSVQDTISEWLYDAFDYSNPQPAFVAMEQLFLCCGTDGASSYANTTLPSRCCSTPTNEPCLEANSFIGCNDMVVSWLDSFGGLVGWVLIGIIIFEVICIIFSLHVSYTIRRNNKGKVIY